MLPEIVSNSVPVSGGTTVDQSRHRPRIGVVIEKLSGYALGGSQAVGFWTVQALKDEYQIVIITGDPDLSLVDVNGFFGTQIHPNELSVLVAPVPTLVRDSPRLRLLASHFVARWCRQLSSEFDLLISTTGEMDLGVRGIQYVHYPLALSNGQSKILAAYNFLSGAIAGYSPRRMALNLTLTNSKWTAQRTKQVYGIEARVTYPPVRDDVPSIPWLDREDGFVCVGRVSPDKNLEGVVRIIKGVRQHAPGVHLHIIGETRDEHYREKIEALLESERDWVFFEGRLPRVEMVKLIAAHRYGIHGTLEEHFGIGIAEMAKAGCLVFVPRGGGQVEIVQSEYLIYDDESDAVKKISNVLSEGDRQSALRGALAERTKEFSSAKFMLEMRAIVSGFLERHEISV